MPDVVQKILDYVLKAVATLVVGGTGWQLFDGRWFGRHIFLGLLRREQVQVLTPPASDDLYGAFGTESLSYAVQGIPPLLLLLALVLLLALIGHVLLKGSLEAAQVALKSYGQRTSRRPVRRILARTCRTYLAGYHAVTVGLFLVLTAAFLLAGFANGLVVLLVLILIPSALYLALYSKDVLAGRFVERFGYLSLLLLLVVVLFMWPSRFGASVFDPSFPLVATTGSEPDHCDPDQLLRGPAFIAVDRPDERQVFRLCFNLRSRQMYVDFFTSEGMLNKTEVQRLSDAVRAFVPPDELADELDVLAVVRSQLGGG